MQDKSINSYSTSFCLELQHYIAFATVFDACVTYL